MKELLMTGVNLPLEYIESENALVGQIKGYSVAVKENNQTGSYGVLIWVKEGGFTAITNAQEYLAERVTVESGFVKNFRVTERGIAIALNKDSNDFTNVTNLKRFLFDLTSSLSLNFYVNCCNECGATEKLSVYGGNGVVVQCCEACGAKYSLLKSFGTESGSSFPNAVSAAAPIAAAVAAPATTKKLSDEEEFRNLFATEKTEPAPEPVTNTVKTTDDGVDISGLMVGAGESEAPKPPRSKLFEEAEREFELEKAREKASQPEVSFEEFMLNDDKSGAGESVTEIKGDNDPVGHSDEFAVTDISDDSNEGEDIEVTEIESLIEKPTETTGHKQLTAEETPLDKDGKVPLVNPNSSSDTAAPSDPYGPDAVQPSEYLKPMPIYDEANSGVDNSPFEDIRAERTANVPGYDNSGEDPRAEKPFVAPVLQPVQSQYGSQPATPYAYGTTAQNAQPTPLPYAATYTPIRVESSNALFGIMGALVFAVLGVLLWIGIYQLGFLSYFGAIAITFAVFFGYRIAGGAQDTKGIVISVILSFVMNLLGHGVCLVFDTQTAIYENYGYHLSFFEGIDWLIYTLGDPSVASSVGVDVLFNVVITIVSIIIAARSMIRGR